MPTIHLSGATRCTATWHLSIPILYAVVALLLLGLYPSLSLRAQQITVATYNVRSLEGDVSKSEGVPFVIQPFVDALRPLDIDLLVLNEVEIMSDRMYQRDLSSELAAGLGMYVAFGKSYDKEGGYYGNAILSRYPIISHYSRALPQPAGSSDPRSLLIADILLPSMAVVRVVATHLDHVAGQVEQLTNLLSDPMLAESPHRTIVAGDLNLTYYPSEQFPASYQLVSPLGATYQSGATLDYITVSPRTAWQVGESSIDYSNQLSDHFPVVVKLTLK